MVAVTWLFFFTKFIEMMDTVSIGLILTLMYHRRTDKCIWT